MCTNNSFTTVTYRQQVLHSDHKAGVANEPVPQSKDVSDRLHQHTAAKQHKVKAGHQVPQAEDVDPCGASDEDETEHQPEEVAEDEHLDHIKVAPENDVEHFSQTTLCVSLKCCASPCVMNP